MRLTNSMQYKEQKTTANSTLALGGLPSPLDNFMEAESSDLRINFSTKKTSHGQSANRYNQFE